MCLKDKDNNVYFLESQILKANVRLYLEDYWIPENISYIQDSYVLMPRSPNLWANKKAKNQKDYRIFRGLEIDSYLTVKLGRLKSS